MVRGLAPLAATLIALTVAAAPVAAATGDAAGPGAADPTTTVEDALEKVAEDGADAAWQDRAIAGAVNELSGLDDLGALRPDDRVIALVTIVDGRITSIAELEDIDQANAELLAQRPTGDGELQPAVAAVLAALTPAQLEAARRGDGSLDAEPWVAALQALAVEMPDPIDDAVTDDGAGGASLGGLRGLAGLAGLDVTVGDEVVVVGAGVVTALVLLLLVVLLQRRGSRNRFTAAVAHGTAIVLEASRRMTGATDADEVRRIAVRTAVDLAGGTTGAWISRGGVEGPFWGTATPDAPLGSTEVRGGPIARALETGTVVRADAASEPWLTTDDGEITVVPVIEDGVAVGAMVVHGPPDAVGAPAASSIRALAPVTASALAAASAHRGAIDAAHADALTGLPNRRRLDLDMKGAGRTGRFAVAMVDVDHFKRFNDTNGHAAGDLALQLVARALGSAVRGGDTVYRYGGEEFCVLLPRATDAAVVKAVAERLRAAVAATVIPGGEGQPGGCVTVSVGVAIREGEQLVEEVLSAADRALYRAKQAGRDQAMVAT